MKRIAFFCAALVFALGTEAQVLKTDFLKGYKVGDNLEKQSYSTATDPIYANTWCAAFNTRHTDDMPAPKVTEGLSYPGYPSDKVAIDLTGFPTEVKGSAVSVYSITDSRTLYRRGSYYVSFLINVKKAPGGLAEVMAADVSYVGNGGRGKFWVKRSDERGKFVASCGARRAPEGVVSKAYDMNKTHLVVLKIDYSAKTVSMFIDPELTDKEPEAEIVAPQQREGEIRNSIRGLQVRYSRSVNAIIGSFRFANNWKAAIGK